MKIREMKLQDKDRVIEMMRVFYDSPALIGAIPEEVLHRNVEDCVGECPYIEGLVFEEDVKILGYAMMAKSYSTEYGGICIWIEDIYMEPEVRGKGVGTACFQYIEEKYKGVAVRYRLEVAKENTNAIHTYEKNGFKPLGYMEMTKEA